MEMNLIKLLPNLVTLSRILFGILVYLFALEGQWIVALVCLAGGAASDGLDGYLAVRLNARSKSGEFLDPASDFIFILFVLAGLIATNVIFWKIVVGLAGIGIAIFTPIVFGKKSNRLRLICEGLHSFYAIAIVISCATLYLLKTGGIILLLITVAIAIPISIKVANKKRHRLDFFWGQILGEEKRNQPHLDIFPIQDFIKKITKP